MSENTTLAEPGPGWAPKFFTIWTGQAFSLIGSALVQFALVWWLTSTTGSATILASATLVAMLPQIFLGPFAGALVDRWDRRWIMIVADASIAAVTGGLVLLFASGQVQVWHVLAALLLRSLGSAFHYPSMAASTSLMVPKRHLARVAGLNQTMQGVIGIFAPPLGALLLAWLPMWGVLAMDIATAALAVTPLLFISIPKPAHQLSQAAGEQAKTSYWHELRAGFAYLVRSRGMFGVVLLAMLLNFLLIPASSLQPLVITRIFEKGPAELAWVEMAVGIGTIVAGLALGAWGGFKRKIVTTLCGVIGIGAGVLMVGLIPADLFWLLVAANFVLGAAQVFANGPLNAIFQSTIEPGMQGRVFSLIGAGASAMMPLSLMIAGPVSDWLGVRAWYLFGGSACVLVTIVAFSIPAIMNVESGRS
jgi:MFS transporter, DHA3 family, macrolide efflux protein